MKKECSKFPCKKVRPEEAFQLGKCPFSVPQKPFLVGKKGLKRSFFAHQRSLCAYFLAIFSLHFAAKKHAKFSKVNAAEKFGVDFFQPSAAFSPKNNHKCLHYNYLENSSKIRVFAAKIFFVQKLQKTGGDECSISHIFGSFSAQN